MKANTVKRGVHHSVVLSFQKVYQEETTEHIGGIRINIDRADGTVDLVRPLIGLYLQQWEQ